MLPKSPMSVSRPGCATQVVLPASLSPGELDAYLAEGWYRIGPLMMGCEVTATGRGLRGVIWTRVPLADYSFRKSLRRAMRRVTSRFEVSVQPFAMTPEHEALYARYLSVAPGARTETLYAFLHGEQPPTEAFDTWEVSVRDGARLVAFSLFDRGAQALQSLVGAFDPELRQYGLGFFTMLREIQHGIEEGFAYFYAGYVMGEDPIMDYKLRTGHIACLDRGFGGWRMLQEGEHPRQLDPLVRMREALGQMLNSALPGSWQLVEHAHFALSAYAPHLAGCLPYPLALVRQTTQPAPDALTLCWDSVSGQYELLRCVRGALATPQGQVMARDLLFVTQSMGRWPQPPPRAVLAMR